MIIIVTSYYELVNALQAI